MFEFIELLPNVHAVYKGEYEKLHIKGVALHCVPHAHSAEAMEANYAKVEADAMVRWNVLITHVGIAANERFETGLYAENIIPDTFLNALSHFDYIALGHYHRKIKVRGNAYYAGSTERFSFRELGYDKGFLDVELENFNVQFHRVSAREMKSFKIDCEEITLPALNEQVEVIAQQGINDAVVEIQLRDIPINLYREIDFRALRQFTKEAFSVKFPPTVKRTEQGAGEATLHIGPLASEFEQFVQNQEIADLDKLKLKQMGVERLARVLESGE
jgi:DNA repair exonuclease SbcCD nuclease subunit